VSDDLYGTMWVHVAEEDSDEGAVFRPEQSDIPLSRRPRQWLQLDPDGKARLYVPGPDDRLVEQAASWTERQGAIVIRTEESGREMLVADWSPDRLVVRTTASDRP
jgi:hypothetical protein